MQTQVREELLDDGPFKEGGEKLQLAAAVR
jgi:hypothetical protein